MDEHELDGPTATRRANGTILSGGVLTRRELDVCPQDCYEGEIVMRRIRPDDLPWTEPKEGVRCKSAIHDSRKVRVVEFSEGFADADWCCAEHIGFVLNGRLEIIFADSADVFSIGDIIMIGKGDKHRARVVEGPVRLFLVEEA